MQGGRGAQNPDLLDAFDLLDLIERNALRSEEVERERRQCEFMAACFGARVRY